MLFEVSFCNSNSFHGLQSALNFAKWVVYSTSKNCVAIFFKPMVLALLIIPLFSRARRKYSFVFSISLIVNPILLFAVESSDVLYPQDFRIIQSVCLMIPFELATFCDLIWRVWFRSHSASITLTMCYSVQRPDFLSIWSAVLDPSYSQLQH